ncbi:MAG TPA: SRPBCC domain-containing protein [Polyangiaceae bacterium]|nr:SRPBCC domain-containing protein [Polyangiaceae bacterium]
MTQHSTPIDAAFGLGGTPPEARVLFPEGQRPHESPVFTRNELAIAAPPERIWAWLVRPGRWPEFYANARNVEIDGGAPDLAFGSRFHWTTFGVRVHTVVQEFVPHHRFAWSGKGLGSSAYHGWVIVPRGGRSLVVTEETQQGIIPSVCRSFLRSGLLKWHQRWLEGLAEQASNGMP